VALVPPQPGWFLWSAPFVGYLAARLSRPGKMALVAMSVLYVLYFFVGDPVVFLEAGDPLFGAGAGARLAARLVAEHPYLFSSHAESIAWTALFSTTVICAFEMYRKGVRSNGIYAFRDQTFMMGVGGDSGAGKHTIARDIAQLFPTTMTLINGDDDHRWERGHAMWRQYTHLDPRGNLLRAQLESLAALRHGGAVRKRRYDHDQGTFTDPVFLAAKDFVTIVGLHPFYLASQRQLLHLRVFVEPKESIRRAWKVARDVKKRGYTPEQVNEQLERRAQDSAKYITPQKRHAHLVVRIIEDTKSETEFAVEYEIDNALDPLTLYDVLSQVEGMTVEWLPDADLQRDLLRVSGELDATDARLLAQVAVPNLDELCDDRLAGFQSGSRGLTQVVLLHAMSARLRAGHTLTTSTGS
jgi:uridine kinase